MQTLTQEAQTTIRCCYDGQFGVEKRQLYGFLWMRVQTLTHRRANGESLLYVANWRGQTEIEQVLVAGGADVNAARLRRRSGAAWRHPHHQPTHLLVQMS